MSRTPTIYWPEGEVHDVPGWVRSYLPHVIQALGAEDWRFTVKAHSEIDEGGTKACVTQCHVYQKILLELADSHMSEDTPEARETIVHEVLHAIHADVEGTMERLVDAIPDKRQRKAWAETYNIANERFIRALAGKLTPLIGAPAEETA